MPTAEDFTRMKSVCPTDIDKTTLVDLQTVIIDTTLPREERLADFLRQIKNPYLFRCGELVVQSIFSDGEATLTDRLRDYYTTLAQADETDVFP